MTEKTDKELATELTIAWLDSNSRSNPNTPFSITMTKDAFNAFFDTIKSAKH